MSPITNEEPQVPEQEEDRNPMAINLQDMERELTRMEAASHKEILERLRERWGSSKDAHLYQELEMNKKRWMLSALYTMDTDVDNDSSKPSSQKIAAKRADKVLVIHENKGEFLSVGSIRALTNIS